MNCKPGDLAVVVRSDNPLNLGRFVRCTELVPMAKVRSMRGLIEGPCWRNVDGLPSWESGKAAPLIPDSYLRPIRDPGDDAKDEMLRPLPKEVTA